MSLPQQKNKLPYKISPVMMNLLYFSNKAPQSHANSMWAKEAMKIKGTTVSRPVTETGSVDIIALLASAFSAYAGTHWSEAVSIALGCLRFSSLFRWTVVWNQ